MVCDDAYTQQELEVLRKFIKPSMVCLQYLHRSTCGTLLPLCKEVYVVLWHGQFVKWEQWREVRRSMQRKLWEREPRMHIVPGVGTESWGSMGRMTPRRLPIQSQQSFSSYVKAATTQNIKYDVVINDGHVKPQVALAVKSELPLGGHMIVFDTARPDKKHYEIISQFYHLVKE